MDSIVPMKILKMLSLYVFFLFCRIQGCILLEHGGTGTVKDFMALPMDLNGQIQARIQLKWPRSQPLSTLIW